MAIRHQGETAVRAALKARLAERGSAKALAAELGTCAAYLSDVKLGKRAITERVAAVVGYRLVTYWEPIIPPATDG